MSHPDPPVPSPSRDRDLDWNPKFKSSVKQTYAVITLAPADVIQSLWTENWNKRTPRKTEIGLSAFARLLSWYLEDISHDDIPTWFPAWWPRFTKTGILQKYIDAILDEDFFHEEDPDYIDSILVGFANIARLWYAAKDYDFGEEIERNVRKITYSLWYRREDFPKVTDVTAEGHDEPAGLETYLPHLGLYCWMQYSSPYDRQEWSLFGPVDIIFDPNRARVCMSTATRHAFIRTVILLVLSFDAVIERFKRVLTWKKELEVNGDATMVLGVMSQILDHPISRPLLQKYEVLHSVADMVQRHSRKGGYKIGERWAEWQPALAFLTYATEDLHAAVTKGNVSDITVRGEDVVIMLARGTDMLAEGKGEASFSLVQGLLREYSHLLTKKSLREIAPELVSGLIRGMRKEWVPTLKILRATRSLDRYGNRDFTGLIEAWKALGRDLGLEERQEVQRLDGRKHCSWRDCKYNMEETNKLSTCQGCGETRYCSRECQKSDWSAGKHKLLCGKRVKGSMG
ncbi:unnamed protein product [Peniophora sp. CBMAI 1063]|nr:unnamed protein product [Peniophora sp. CBMAI 1063]